MAKAPECSVWFKTSYSHMSYTLSLLVHDQSFPEEKGLTCWLSMTFQSSWSWFWWDATMVRYSIWTWAGTKRRKKLDPSREAMDLPTCHRLRRQRMGCTLWGVFATRWGCLGNQDKVLSLGGGDPTPLFFSHICVPKYKHFLSSQILNSHLIQEILRCFHRFLPFKSLVRWAAVGCHYLNSYKHPRLITSKCGPCRHVGGYLCFG